MPTPEPIAEPATQRTAARPEAPTPVRFSVDDYHRMAEAGILSADDRVELLDGYILPTSPIGSQHAGTVLRLTQLLTRLLGERAFVSVQNPLRLGDRSEPEPDVMVLWPRADFYASAHPTPADVLLLIEVADTTLAFDRTTKVPLYARHGIAEVWVVDLGSGSAEGYQTPFPDGYDAVRRYRYGDRLALPFDLACGVEDVVGEAGAGSVERDP